MSLGSVALSALLKKATIEDHDEVLKACNAILKESKSDLNVLHVKVIALIKSDRFDDALRVFDDGGDKIKAKASLEHAYLLYKVGRHVEARSCLHSLSQDRGTRHLEAQVSYRSEDFQRAARLYRELGEENGGLQNEADDLRINASATNAQLEWRKQRHFVGAEKASRQDLEAFETAYNAACICIARGELLPAEFLLKRAKDLCDLSDDLSTEDKAAELLSILTQQIYVSLSLGNSKLAEDLTDEVSLEKISDLSTKHVAQANISASPSHSKNPYLVHRMFQPLPISDKNDALFRFQKDILSCNGMALDLQMSKFDGVVNRTAKALKEQPLTSLGRRANISVANAAAHAQNRLGKLGLKAILPLLEVRPNDVGLMIIVIHLYVLMRNHGSAILVLESFLKRLNESVAVPDQDARYAPGIVALLVSLYSIEGRMSQVKAELVKATSYWRSKSKLPLALLQATGLSLLDTMIARDLEEAREIFVDLHTQNSQDRIARAGTVASSATTKTEEIKKLTESLTPIARLTSGIDVDSLEQMGIPRTITHAATRWSKKRTADTVPTENRKRVRRSHLPEGVDPRQKADPERWLPLRDRSTYRPKGKKGKQRAAALTQGGQVERTGDGLNTVAVETGAKTTSSVLGGPSKTAKKKRPKQ